jgi:hypothetical protein
MIVKFVPKPDVNSCTLFAPVGEFKNNVLKDNSVRFSVRFETKTYLDFSVQAGQCRFSYNEKSPYSVANNLTLVEKKEWSYFSGRQKVDNYFKRTKKQNLEVMKNHIVSLTEQMLNDFHITELVNLDTFVISIELPQELMEHIDRQLSASRG